MAEHSTTNFDVSGLVNDVEILVDKFGVPHLYAQSQDDAFLAQGFNAARDRLFQMDLWRRRGLGRLSEVFGAHHAERDRAARLFLYRGDMRAEWLAYGSDTKRVTTSFVRGVNAFVTLARDNRALLPAEFRALGYLPALWEPTDIARIRSHGLFYNVEQEFARARTLHEFGPEVENLRRVREPHLDLTVPDGLDISAIPEDVLRVYRLATTMPLLDAADREPKPRYEPDGSNNWVLAPTRTATGRPILANDPHRAILLPGLRYVAHLNAPGLDVIGGGEPALPGISIGHNGQIAFGLTIFAIDQEDLYIYETNPEEPTEYRYDGRWEPMTVVRDEVEVRDGEPVSVQLLFTRHGPVIHQETANNRAFAVRAAWLEPGMAPYLGSMDYMRAQDPDAFVSAMNRWGAPGENQVYAAPDGTIGWRPAGVVPIRPNWDGTLPVPGDGRYEWAGFYDVDQLPDVRNPESGWFSTANEMNLPADYPNDERTVSYDWYPSVRQERITEALSQHSDWTVEGCVQLQTDYLSIPARRIVSALQSFRSDDARAAEAANLLVSWDCRLTQDSAPAALFEIWYRRHLRPALLTAALSQVVPQADVAKALARILPVEDLAADCRVDLELLLDPGTRLGPDPSTVISELLSRSLASALVEVEERLGTDRGAWSWGALHRARPRHPQASLLGEEHVGWTSVGPVPRGGSGDTVGSTAYTPDFVQSGGATFRLVVDVGDWDKSVFMNSPGQSGVPDSPHYRDLFEAWGNDAAFPLLYSREAVVEHTGHRIVLRPSPA